MNFESLRRRDVLKLLGAGGIGAGSSVGSVVGDRSPAGDTTPGGTSVTLLHDTHFHGRFRNPFAEARNIANYFGVMDDIARQHEHVLRLGNGDDLASSVLSAVFEGQHIVDAFNAGGLAYDTYGNHDFDLGPATLRQRVGESNFTWVSANVRDERTGAVFARAQGAKRYDVRRVGDVPIGVTGLITPEAPEVTSIGEHTLVGDPVEAMREVVPRMRRDGAKVIVVLSHLAHDTAEDVAANVGNIDVIVGDHAASVLEEPKVVHETLLSFAGDQFEYVGELTLHLTGKTLSPAHYDFTLHSVTEAVNQPGFTPNAAVDQVMRSYEEQVNERLDVVIGRTTEPLDTRTEVVRRTESNMGNFIADALRSDVNAEIGLMNGGGIRTDTLYPNGDITKKMVVNILPFPNNTVKLEVSGDTLQAALENGVSKVTALAGRFPQVSGLRYTYDPAKPVGERIVAVTIDGESLDSSATYTLATNDFVAAGGDGYDMLADANVLRPANEGTLLSHLVTETIQLQTPISPEPEGRITRI